MRRGPLKEKMGKKGHAPGKGGGFTGGAAYASHTGVDFKMKSKARPAPGRGVFEFFGKGKVRDQRIKVAYNTFVKFLVLGQGKKQYRRIYARVPELCPLSDSGYSQMTYPAAEGKARHFHGPVAVGVGLDRKTNFGPLPYPRPDGLNIVFKVFKMNQNPCCPHTLLYRVFPFLTRRRIVPRTRRTDTNVSDYNKVFGLVRLWLKFF
jgi:hypothetical protein